MYNLRWTKLPEKEEKDLEKLEERDTLEPRKKSFLELQSPLSEDSQEEEELKESPLWSMTKQEMSSDHS